MPSSWTDRNDQVAGACSRGPVDDHEEAARLVSVEMCPVANDIRDCTFPKEVLLKPTGEINNACGQREGESLLRRLGRTDDQLLAESDANFDGAKSPSAGVIVALVERIRSIRAPDAPENQVFYIYEDPNAKQPHHAVIRYSEGSSRAWVRLARKELIKCFVHLPRKAG